MEPEIVKSNTFTFVEIETEGCQSIGLGAYSSFHFYTEVSIFLHTILATFDQHSPWTVQTKLEHSAVSKNLQEITCTTGILPAIFRILTSIAICENRVSNGIA